MRSCIFPSLLYTDNTIYEFSEYSSLGICLQMFSAAQLENSSKIQQGLWSVRKHIIKLLHNDVATSLQIFSLYTRVQTLQAVVVVWGEGMVWVAQRLGIPALYHLRLWIGPMFSPLLYVSPMLSIMVDLICEVFYLLCLKKYNHLMVDTVNLRLAWFTLYDGRSSRLLISRCRFLMGTPPCKRMWSGWRQPSYVLRVAWWKKIHIYISRKYLAALPIIPHLWHLHVHLQIS